MDQIWSILGLEPTRDVSAIRRAYADKSRACHPEEDPTGFMRLREAYQAALAYGSGNAAVQPQMTPSETAQAALPQQQENGEDGREPDEEGEDRPNDAGWSLLEEAPDDSPNPYADHEAIQKFVELYTGKQRKNPKLWMDYFTSKTFLDVAWEPRFTELMLEKVTEVERILPPGKEFLSWLSVVYLFSVTEKLSLNREAMRVDNLGRHVQLSPEADFEGMESILCIATKGAPPKPLRGNEFAIAQSFADYRHLDRLARSGGWNEQAVMEYRDIVGRYVSAYIKEKCEQRVKPDLERHLAGLRVFTYFFESHELPEELYRFLWEKLGLKMAIMGRSKAMYGRLREIVVERVPGIDEEAVENFLQLNRALDAYLARIKENPEREEEESAAFYEREDLQKALHSVKFVEKELLTYSKWRREEIGEGLVRRILGFYRENPNVSGADKVIEGMTQDLQRRAILRWNQEDAQADPEGIPYYVQLTLRHRPFFRHWLNTGFYTAQDPESGAPLSDYLRRCLPYQEEWSRRFLKQEDGSIQPRTVAVCMGEVEVDLYLRHMEFRVNGRPVYRPCLLWERTMIESGEWFLLLLPITVAPRSWFPEVERTILHHLAATAAPEEDRAFIAGCLAGAVCCLPEDQYTKEPVPPEEVLPLEFFAEDGDRLFGCSWYESERRLVLFEQTASGRRVNKECELGPEVDDAVAAARRMLDKMVSPDHFDLSMLKQLPWNIYFTPNDGTEQTLTRADLKQSFEENAEDDVTEKALSSLLSQFARGELERLELRWFEGKLVFIAKQMLLAGQMRYACFYFSSNREIWYSMLSKPSVYRTVESDDVVYVPFGMGQLPDYVIHETPASILRNLDRVFMQLAQGEPQAQGSGGWLWDSNVSRLNGRHKLLMAQQKLGGISPHRGRNSLNAKFVMNQYPVQLESVDLDGERTLAEIKSGSYGQAADALSLFVRERLAKLRLSWEFKTPEGEAFRRHMVLLRDSFRFMMVWLQDDKEWAQYFKREPDDRPNAEGEGQNMAAFLDWKVPARAIHYELLHIRNCVDLILDDMSNTDPVTERPGEFITAERPYHEIRAELMGE